MQRDFPMAVMAEASRLIDVMGATDPKEPTYTSMVECLQMLTWLVRDMLGVPAMNATEADQHPVTDTVVAYEAPKKTRARKTPAAPVEETPAAPVEETPAAPVEETPTVQEETPAEAAPTASPATTPEPVEEKTYTKAEVRAALGKARHDGLDLAKVFASVGASDFSGVAVEQYGAIMDILTGKTVV